MAKCHNMVASGLLPPAAIFPKKDWNGWDPSATTTRVEAYASSQWSLPSSSSSSSSSSFSSSGDAESFLEKQQSPDYHSYGPWQAREPPMQRGHSSMMMIWGEGELAPSPQGTMFPRQLLNCPYSSTSFAALPAQFFSQPRMEVDSSSPYDSAPSTFEAYIPLKSSSPTSFNSDTTTSSFDACGGPYGPAFDSSDSSEASYGSTSPFESYYPYDSPPPFISSPSHDSSDQDFAAAAAAASSSSPAILDHHANEQTDPSAPFLYTPQDNDDDRTLSCSQQNMQLDYYLSSCQGGERPDLYSTGNGNGNDNGYQTYNGQSHSHNTTPLKKIPVELASVPAPATKSKKVLKKPYACFPCEKGFERHEHLTRHKLTMTHRKTLKDRGIPCYDPPPQMTACPFCSRKFNRSDNLKPHMLTHMHLAGENKRNTPISIEDSVRCGQAKIDPRLKQMQMQIQIQMLDDDAKKNVAQVRSLLNYGGGGGGGGAERE